MNTRSRLSVIIGSFFGCGFLPAIPGTWGSLAALPVIWVIFDFVGIWALALFTVIACIFSWWSTAEFERRYGSDPGPLVMDEVAGMSLCMLLIFAFWPVESNWQLWLAGFLFFRFFDIIKILGTDALQNIGGGAGVLLDDLLAGFYAHLATVLLILFVF